jgi:hypothetical protein
MSKVSMMAMEEREKALEVMKAEQALIRIDIFDQLREVLDADDNLLRAMGYDNKDLAIRVIVRLGITKCDAVAKAFVRKYPDGP